MYETRFAAINGRLAVGSGGDAERNDLVEAIITAGADSNFASTGRARGNVKRVQQSFLFAGLQFDAKVAAAQATQRARINVQMQCLNRPSWFLRVNSRNRKTSRPPLGGWGGNRPFDPTRFSVERRPP